MVQILADENFPWDAVKALRKEGYKVLWVQEISPGISDEEVLQIAIEEKCVVVTFDKDFGELSFRKRLPAYCGVVLFRIVPLSSAYLVKIITEFFKSRSDWEGNFFVVEANRIRVRPMFKSGELEK